MKYYHIYYKLSDFWDEIPTTECYSTVIDKHPYDWALEKSTAWENNYDRQKIDILSWQEMTEEEYDKYIKNKKEHNKYIENIKKTCEEARKHKEESKHKENNRVELLVWVIVSLLAVGFSISLCFVL